MYQDYGGSEAVYSARLRDITYAQNAVRGIAQTVIRRHSKS